MIASTAAPVSHGIREGEDINLDDVDFGWQVARDFETNFLLADGRLGPNLHARLLHRDCCVSKIADPSEGPPIGFGADTFVRHQSADQDFKVKSKPLRSLENIELVSGANQVLSRLRVNFSRAVR